MAIYEWSHTNEAIENVRDNIFLLPKKTLRVIWKEWGGKPLPKDCPKDVLANAIFDKAAEQRICTSQRVMMDTAWICPEGCHTVPFDLMRKERKLTLTQKFHPKRFTTSGKMTAILAYYLGQHWTEPEIESIYITSDGMCGCASEFFGLGQDLIRNLKGAADVAELTPKERARFQRLVIAKTDNWSSISLDI